MREMRGIGVDRLLAKNYYTPEKLFYFAMIFYYLIEVVLGCQKVQKWDFQSPFSISIFFFFHNIILGANVLLLTFSDNFNS